MAIRAVNLGIAVICFITAIMCKCPTLKKSGAMYKDLNISQQGVLMFVSGI